LFLIRVRNLVHTYDGAVRAPALRGVDLDIDEGEYVALVGANGSGKTTLARHLNALLLPTSGEVLIDGHDTRDPGALRAIRSTVGMVLQSPPDQMVATIVEEDVAFGPENLGLPQEELGRRVREALEQVGMWSQRHRPPHMLSAGQQQRVAIAGVLAMRPRCLVLDEATAMLDPAGQRDRLSLVRDLHADGMTVVTITHAMPEAVEAQRLVVLHEGRVVRDGSPARVLRDPDLARFGLAAPPAIDLARRLQPVIPGLGEDLATADAVAQAIAGEAA